MTEPRNPFDDLLDDDDAVRWFVRAVLRYCAASFVLGAVLGATVSWWWF